MGQVRARKVSEDLSVVSDGQCSWIIELLIKAA